MTLALVACTQDEWNGNNGNTNGATGAVVVITPGEKPGTIDNGQWAIDNGQLTMDNYDAAPASKSFSTPPPERGGAFSRLKGGVAAGRGGLWAGGSHTQQGAHAQQGASAQQDNSSYAQNPLPPTGYSPFQAGEPQIVPTDGSAATHSAAPNCQLSTVNCQLPTATRTASTRTAPTTGAWASGDRIFVTLQYFSDDLGTYPDLDAQGNPLPGTGALIDTDALGLPTSQTLTYTPETSDQDNNTIPAHWTADPARLPLPPGARSLRASYRMTSAPDPLTATCEQMAGYLPSGDYPLSTLHSQPSTVLGPDRGSGITMRVRDHEKEMNGQDWTALYFGNLTLPDADMQAQIAADGGMKIYYAQMTRVYAALVPIEDPTQPVVLPAPVWKRQSTALILQDLRPGQTVDVEKSNALSGRTETVPLALPAHYTSPADVRLHFMARRQVIVNSNDLLDTPYDSSPNQRFFALTDPAVALHQPLLRPRYERVEYWPGEQFVIPASALYLGSEGQDMQAVDGTDHYACYYFLTAKNTRWIVSGGKTKNEAVTVMENVSGALEQVARADASARIDVLLTEAVVLPRVLTTGAFIDCTALRSISAPQAESMGNDIFYGCFNLQAVSLPKLKGNIGDSTFRNCSSLNTLYLPLLDGGIGGYAFSGCEKLTTLSLPQMKGYIGQYAFNGCKKLTSLSLPQMASSIGDDAFSGCIALQSIDLPQMAGGIGQYAFRDCKALQSISLPQMTGGIGFNAFYGCEALQTLDLPQMKGSIGSYAFQGCKALTTLSLPQMEGDIDGYAFLDCKALTTLSLPQMKGGIGSYAFYDCEALTTVSLPQMEGDIGNSAFQGCEALTTVSLPQMEGGIGVNAFKGCKALTTISLPQMKGSIGGNAFYGCEALTTVSLPQMEGSIGVQAFSGCEALTTDSLPQMKGSIGEYAFQGCEALQSISLPAMKGTIGERAFSGCPLLKRLELTSPGITQMEERAFEDLDIAASTGFVLVLGKGQQCFKDGKNGQFIDTAGDYVIIYLTPVTSTTPMHNDNNPTVRVEVIPQP